MNSDQRLTVLDAALTQIGKPYIWGAKGPERFDCSGLATFCLIEAGFKKLELLFSPVEIQANKITAKNWMHFCNADRLMRNLPKTPEPTMGDLCFYGRKKRSTNIAIATHVVIYLGDGQIIGANGGNSLTTSPQPGAKVSKKKSYRYRPDFLQFGSLVTL